MSPPLGCPVVFVEDLERPEFDDQDRHHLSRVLRLRAGAALVVADGHGRWRTGRFDAVIEVDGPVFVDPAPAPAITVAFAPVKGDRPEWMVQKLTELGVDRIVPLVVARSVVRWDSDRATHALTRLKRAAREAGRQCRRTRLPVIDAPRPFAELVSMPGTCLAAQGGDPPTLERPVALIGPEGGWSPDELAAAPAVMSLGPYVLRAETAAMTAGALLVALRSGLLATRRRGTE